MAMSDCVRCWDTPCTCGWDYRDYTREARIRQAAAVLGLPQDKLGEMLGNAVPVSHPMKSVPNAEAETSEMSEWRMNERIDDSAPASCSACASLRKKRIADLEHGMKEIAYWAQEDQDDPQTCAMQWRGCVAIARELLKSNVQAHFSEVSDSERRIK